MNGSTMMDGHPTLAGGLPASPGSGAGTFPGFGATTQPVAESDGGTALTASRSDHKHPILTTANATTMSAIDVTLIPDGTPVYVISRDGVFCVITTAKATNTWDTFATTDANRRWCRIDHTSLKSAIRTTWAIDTAGGSDDNTGAGGSPLLTFSELAWRLSNAFIPANVTVTVTGSMVATDLPFFSFRLSPAATWTFTFTPTDIYTSTIGVVTNAAAGPNAGDNNFTDPAVPGGSFTAAGALASGVIGRRLTTSYFWFAKDLGATTVRFSRPSAALANGNSYTAMTLPTVNVMRFVEQRYSSVNIQFGYFVSGATPMTDSCLRFDRCWFVGSGFLSFPGVAYSNCAWEGNANISQGAAARGLLFTTGGMMRGSGAQGVIATLGSVTSAINTSLTLQGANLEIQGGFCAINADQYINDYTGVRGAITAGYWGIILWYTGAFVGSGNTNYLLYADRMSQISAVTNPIAVAGSSPSGTPIEAVGTPAFSVANMANGAGVLNRGGNGVYYTNNAADAPLIAYTGNAVNGVVLVTLNNAPAGSPAAPVRWAQIPDGAGGLLTVPSIT